jgi:hypothetical protein
LTNHQKAANSILFAKQGKKGLFSLKKKKKKKLKISLKVTQMAQNTKVAIGMF